MWLIPKHALKLEMDHIWNDYFLELMESSKLFLEYNRNSFHVDSPIPLILDLIIAGTYIPFSNQNFHGDLFFQWLCQKSIVS